MRRLTILAACAALLLAACGDDDDAGGAGAASTTLDAATSDLRDEYVAELAAEMEGDPEFPLDETQSTCFAEAVVDTVGAGAIEETGVTPKTFATGSLDGEVAELIDDRRDGIATAVADCRLGGVFAGALGVSGDAAECFSESIDERELAGLLVGAALGEEDRASGEAFGEAIMAGLPGPCAKQIVVELFVAEGVLDEDGRACVEERLSEELANRLLDVEQQRSDPEGLEAEMRDALGPCA